jgi:hypothetical protein
LLFCLTKICLFCLTKICSLRHPPTRHTILDQYSRQYNRQCFRIPQEKRCRCTSRPSCSSSSFTSSSSSRGQSSRFDVILGVKGRDLVTQAADDVVTLRGQYDYRVCQKDCNYLLCKFRRRRPREFLKKAILLHFAKKAHHYSFIVPFLKYFLCSFDSYLKWGPLKIPHRKVISFVMPPRPPRPRAPPPKKNNLC